MANDTYKWERVYEVGDLTIDMDTSKVTFGQTHIGRVTFRWTWAELHSLKLTPGGSYKSRIELTEIDCVNRRFHTAEVRLFDAQGKPIELNRFVPSTKWDSVKPGGIMEGIFPHACKLIASRSK
jgi:hypothetical protein